MNATIGGIRLYYEKTGTGSPVLLLHGNGGSIDVFRRAIPLLAKKHTVWALDSRCHGKSENAETLLYSDLAADTAAFIRDVIGEPVAVIGHSDGGITALLLAIDYPDTVTQIFPCGANSSPAGLKAIFTVPTKLAYRFTHDRFRAMMLYGPHIDAGMLARIECPVHLLAGQNDLIRLQDTLFIANHCKNSTVDVLPGEDHTSYIRKGKKLLRVLEQYLT